MHPQHARQPLCLYGHSGYKEFPWLFTVSMNGVVREVNVRVIGKGLELLSANGTRFEINQLLFAGDKH